MCNVAEQKVFHSEKNELKAYLIGPLNTALELIYLVDITPEDLDD